MPWAPDVQVVYEHLHRYMWAARVVAGRGVLDLGSGEGFGAAILAGSATHVVGLDVDGLTVVHSRLNYGAANLEFRVGTALNLSAFEDGALVRWSRLRSSSTSRTGSLGLDTLLGLGSGGRAPARAGWSEARLVYRRGLPARAPSGRWVTVVYREVFSKARTAVAVNIAIMRGRS